MRKKWLIVLGLVIIFVSSIAVSTRVKDSNNSFLKLNTIVKTLEKQGLSIEDNNSKSLDNDELNKVKPAIFSLGKNKDTLLIYIFSSFTERKKASEGFDYSNFRYLDETPYNAKNALLVFKPSQIPKSEDELKDLLNTRALISATVFKDLNDGKEIVYKGQSASWEGTFDLKYYEHLFEDKEGKINSDNYTEIHPVIKYKMSDISNAGPVTFEYKTSKLTRYLNKEGYIDVGITRDNSKLNLNEEINFTINWNGKVEHIVLKATN